MTTPTSEDPFPPQADVVQDAPPPFADQVTFPLTKQVELTQLADELTRALKRQVQVAQLGPEHGWVPSEDNPAVLAISPSNVNANKVRQVIDAHQPDLGYGVSDEEKAFTALSDRLLNDPTAELSDEDVRVAVRGLMLRQSPGPV